MTEAVPKLNGVHADSDDEVRITVLDPYAFVRIRIQHSRLNTDPDLDLIQIQGFDDQKLTNNFKVGKRKKICVTKLQFTRP